MKDRDYVRGLGNDCYCLYYARLEIGGVYSYKIGVTKKLKKRVYQLERSCEADVTILHTEYFYDRDEAYQAESMIKRIFKLMRSEGSTFSTETFSIDVLLGFR